MQATASRGSFWEFLRADVPALLERYPTEAVFAAPPATSCAQLLATLGVTVSIDRSRSTAVTVRHFAG